MNREIILKLIETKAIFDLRVIKMSLKRKCEHENTTKYIKKKPNKQ